MKYFFIGNNYVARRKALDQQRKKWIYDGYDIQHFFSDETPFSEIEQMLRSETLFPTKRAFILYDYLQDIPDKKSDFLIHNDYEIVYVCRTGTHSLVKKNTEGLNSDEYQVLFFNQKDNTKKEIFSIADAVQECNSKKAWLVYRDLLSKGYNIRQIFGTIWWSFKNMGRIHVGNISSSDHIDMSPFLMKKFQHALKNYTDISIFHMMKYFLDIYHTNIDDRSLENSLESFLLKINNEFKK